MNAKVLKTLEFNKITDALSEQAYSKAAKELCHSLAPSGSLDEIKKAQEETTAAVSRIRRKHAPAFSPLKDVIPSLRRIEIGSPLGCAELLDIAGNLEVALSIKQFLEPDNSLPEADALTFYYEELEPCENLREEINRCIPAPDEISDDASSALCSIRRQKVVTGGRIQRALNGLITSQNMKPYLQDSLVTIRQGRYCIPVKAEHKNHIPGMIHDESGSGATVFIEPMSVVRLNNELKELDIKEEEEIRRILEHLCAMCSGFSESIENDYNLLVRLDFIFAKARYSEIIKGNEPEFNNDGFIELKQARHPLLGQKNAVPIDISIGRDFSMLIVTGPNTGGKTVSLKTTGLLCLMGLSGLHIPAFNGSSLCVFDEIYADIGDEQSIEQSLSTFSSHMTNIVDILNKAGSGCLILLDELCSGTDPTEGAALAQAILTRLLKLQSRVMATTHYSELKLFALSTPGVQNACCEFDIETLRPTYRLLTGLPGKSNAFAISKKLGLGEEIIDDARGRINEENVSFEDLLAQIEDDRKTARSDREEAALALKEAQEQRKCLKKERDALNEKEEKIINDARIKACEILDDAKDFADQAIRDMRKNAKDADLSDLERTRTQIGKRAKQERQNLGLAAGKASAKPAALTARTARLGMDVKVISMDAQGVITSEPDSKGRVNVQIGIFNKRINLSDLAPLDLPQGQHRKDARPASSSGGFSNYSKALGISHEIKLIGLTVDDALLELDKYLDDAQIAHLGQVRIVHGKGTGALRNAVQNMLRRDGRVKTFRMAEYGEGDAGVTIAELK